jgi:hypothetical protein
MSVQKNKVEGMNVKVMSLAFLVGLFLFISHSFAGPDKINPVQSSDESSPSSGTFRIVLTRPEGPPKARVNSFVNPVQPPQDKAHSSISPPTKVDSGGKAENEAPPAVSAVVVLVSAQLSNSEEGRPPCEGADLTSNSNEADPKNNPSAAAAAAASGQQPGEEEDEHLEEDPRASPQANYDSDSDSKKDERGNNAAPAASAAARKYEKPVDNIQYQYTKKDLPALKTQQKGLKKIADAYRKQIAQAKKNKEENIAWNFQALLEKTNEDIASLQKIINQLDGCCVIL